MIVGWCVIACWSFVIQAERKLRDCQRGEWMSRLERQMKIYRERSFLSEGIDSFT